MKLYTVYNGFMGYASIRVSVVAENKDRAYEIASEAFEKESMRDDGTHLYPESYWTNLDVVLEFDPEQDAVEAVGMVNDG